MQVGCPISTCATAIPRQRSPRSVLAGFTPWHPDFRSLRLLTAVRRGDRMVTFEALPVPESAEGQRRQPVTERQRPYSGVEDEPVDEILAEAFT